MFPPAGQLVGGVERRSALIAGVAAVGVDHACVGDHVSFKVGAGYDGVVAAASLLSLHPDLPVYVGLFLLPLRHPVPVARSLTSIAELAPGG
jgi:alkanesulfonate monooxygenase SsuD/methylene tetrahydromethanopterin reductase-like flavin-dependent oxidoreductase (luciferase family)